MKNFSSKIPLGNNKYAYEQEPNFKVLGEELTDRVLSVWKPPSIFYHLKDGGHVAALRKHLENNHFSNFDVSRFFYRVTKNKILRSLIKHGFSFEDANFAASHSVVKSPDGYHLPYGFTQSPILASLVLHSSRAGKFLRRIDKDVAVSVYVDDIILSHHDDPKKLDETSRQLVEQFGLSGFPISEEKLQVCEPRITSFNVEIGYRHSVITDDRMSHFDEQIRENIDNPFSTEGIQRYVAAINDQQGREIGEMIKQASGRS